ncbi:CLUMA_CG015787, isoform A [Clunio marinus]|uniref:CLUMA_CG015787, isoform A n=1 Tax=Clunio marinus TaxID=568069 RepID=A0A1J1IRR3_9DIPT|nr:CLUMA_CG015787, isoform A [Clunio marinus]
MGVFKNNYCISRNVELNAMLVYKSFYFFITILVFETSYVNGTNQLHIGGIFPIAGKGGWQGGQACMPAANLALEDVNNNPDLLPGFQLTLHSNDSEVSKRIEMKI